MSRFRLISRIAGDFISLIFPRLCQCCGEHLVRNEEIICTSCIIDIPTTGFHKLRDNEMEKSLWGRCYVEKAAAWSYYTNGGRIQTLVHRLKYNGITSIGTFLGKMYGNILNESGFLSEIDLIIPVPLHKKRERRRGFNQSAVIGEALSLVSGIPISKKILRRRYGSGSQTRKSRSERWENVDGIFVADGELLSGISHILIVDDVVTTGSTIEACVNSIKEVAEVKVSVVSLAVARSGSI